MCADLATWTAHLRTLATPAQGAGVSASFDLAVPLGIAIGVHPPMPTPDPKSISPEARLWWARVDPSVDVDDLVTAGDDDGPVLPQNDARGMEVWTDAELSALHALWWLGRIRDRPAWPERVTRAARWHLEHTQPDNATNRPWALHVFLLEGTPEGEHYAATLLHASRAGPSGGQPGQPEPFGAMILMDAAMALEA